MIDPRNYTNISIRAVSNGFVVYKEWYVAPNPEKKDEKKWDRSRNEQAIFLTWDEAIGFLKANQVVEEPTE